MLACAVCHLAEISIDDNKLTEMNLYIAAIDLNHSILRKEGNRWTTMHPRWSAELLHHIYGKDDVRCEKYLKHLELVISKVTDNDFELLLILNQMFILTSGFLEFDFVKKISEKQIKEKPDSIHADFYALVLGIALTKLGRYDEAIIEYDKAIAVKPDKHEAMYNKGSALASLGKYDESIKYLEQLQKINPNYPKMQETLSLIYKLKIENG